MKCRNCGVELIWHDDASPDIDGTVWEPEWVHAPEVPSSCGDAQPTDDHTEAGPPADLEALKLKIAHEIEVAT